MSQPLDRPATALLVIDVQQGFRAPGWGSRNQPHAERQVGLALAAARARGLPVIHVRHDSTKADSPLRPGQAGNDFAAEARPLPGEPIVPKRVHSAFIGTDLERRLTALGIRHLLIAGIATDHCVSTTARMAANMGYEVTVLSDATTAFDRRDHDGEVVPAAIVHRAALASLAGEFARITTVAGAFAALALTLVVSACQTAETFEVAKGSVAPGSQITWNGEPTALAPGKLAIGQPLPDVTLVDLKMQPVALAQPGKVRVISIVPSLDTPVCDVQTHSLGETAVLSPDVERVTISADLPYAQRRFVEESKLLGITYLSDYRGVSFGKSAGLQLDRNGLLARAVVVVDRQGIVRYIQVVPEITQLPDLTAAYAAANAL